MSKSKLALAKEAVAREEALARDKLMKTYIAIATEHDPDRRVRVYLDCNGEPSGVDDRDLDIGWVSDERLGLNLHKC